jgi:hypothetical protein
LPYFDPYNLHLPGSFCIRHVGKTSLHHITQQQLLLLCCETLERSERRVKQTSRYSTGQ